MKRILSIFCIYLFVVIILSSLMTGCSANNYNTEQNAISYVENEDFQNFIDSSSAFAKVNSGYYFLKSMKLYFFDTKAKEAYIVCNKPNCEHNSNNCTAFFSIFNYYPFRLSYFNNSLYVLGWEEEGSNLRHNYIYEISLDNYKRKRAAFLFDGTDTNSVSFIIHRGYIYYIKGGLGDLKETTSYLYRKKLGNTSKKEKVETVYEFSGIGASIIDLKASGNNLVVLNASYGDINGNAYKTSYTLIDIHSLESKVIVGNKAYSLFAVGDVAYYEKGEKKVYRVDLNTGKEEFFCDIDSPCYISVDSNYIYFDNLQSIYIEKVEEKNRKILVYDKAGNYVTDIVPKNPKDDCYFGGDDIMIFKENIVGETIIDNSDANSAKGYYVLDKSQLTSNDKQFIDME